MAALRLERSKSRHLFEPLVDDLLRFGREMVVVIKFGKLERAFGEEQVVDFAGAFHATLDVVEGGLVIAPGREDQGGPWRDQSQHFVVVVRQARLLAQNAPSFGW